MEWCAFFSNQEEEFHLETKGGSIQTMLLKDVTHFGSIDLIIGDVDGVVTLFFKITNIMPS